MVHTQDPILCSHPVVLHNFVGHGWTNVITKILAIDNCICSLEVSSLVNLRESVTRSSCLEMGVAESLFVCFAVCLVLYLEGQKEPLRGKFPKQLLRGVPVQEKNKNKTIVFV